MSQERAEDQNWRTARYIKMAREDRDMSRLELAAALAAEMQEPWSDGMVQKLENGLKACTPDILNGLVKILGMPHQWFFEGPRRTAPQVGTMEHLTFLLNQLRSGVALTPQDSSETEEEGPYLRHKSQLVEQVA